MDRSVAITVTALVGGLLAMQPVINAGLARSTSGVAAALVSFGVGSLILAVIVVGSGNAGTLSSTFSVSWYYLLGGLLGAVYVFWALTAVKTIGAGGLAAATITGQLTMAIILDRIGFLGLDEIAIDASRLIGVGLLLAGTYLIVR